MSCSAFAVEFDANRMNFRVYRCNFRLEQVPRNKRTLEIYFDSLEIPWLARLLRALQPIYLRI